MNRLFRCGALAPRMLAATLLMSGLGSVHAADPLLVLSGTEMIARSQSGSFAKNLDQASAKAVDLAVGSTQLNEINYAEAALMGLAIIMNDNDNDGEPATFTGGSGSNFAGGSG